MAEGRVGVRRPLEVSGRFSDANERAGLLVASN